MTNLFATAAHALFAAALISQSAPPGVAFYQPPSPLPAGSPGDVIWTRALDSGSALPSAAQNILVLYHTRSATGSDVAVSGTIAIPKGTPPPNGWPVISWAHGTIGNGPQCAPSRAQARNVEQRMLDSWVASGYAVLQTDYEGIGTPGVHPYFVGAASIHDVTDIVRAARHVDPQTGDRWIAMGHSEGGSAAIFAAVGAQRWAPELHLLGAISYAPGSHIMYSVSNAVQSSAPSPWVALSLLMVQGMATADPHLSLTDILSPQGIAKLDDLQTRCIGDAMNDAAWKTTIPSSLFRRGGDLMTLASDLNANDPDGQRLAVPALLFQGTADAVVGVDATAALAHDLCSNKATLTYSAYPGAAHDTILNASLKEAQAWAAARFAGDPAPSNCGRQ